MRLSRLKLARDKAVCQEPMKPPTNTCNYALNKIASLHNTAWMAESTVLESAFISRLAIFHIVVEARARPKRLASSNAI